MPTKLEKVVDEIRQCATITKVDLSNAELTEFPSELNALFDTLEFLNLGGNKLKNLPQSFVQFKKLRILFFAQNEFEEIPKVLGQMESLTMLSFKSNKLSSVPAQSLCSSISWLILTDNQISELPPSIGNLRQLRKLMLSGNNLSNLPEELGNCQDLELVRLAANNLSTLPDWLLNLPKLAWLAFGGNSIEAEGEHSDYIHISTIQWSDLEVKEKIGEGASGFVHKAVLSGESTNHTGEVAVKLFKGETTSDGLPVNEMEATESVGEHPNFIPVLGRIANAPNNQLGLVLPLLDTTPGSYEILGNPPSFDTCTRDTFPEECKFSFETIFKVLLGMSAACMHLHTAQTVGGTSFRRAITHGDLYAHNILVHQLTGHALLTDFGAASFKPTDSSDSGDVSPGIQNRRTRSLSADISLRLEQIEVRAFGCLLDDLLSHADMETLSDREGEEGTASPPGGFQETTEETLQIIWCLANASTKPSIPPAATVSKNAVETVQEESDPVKSDESSAAMEALHMGVHSRLLLLLKRMRTVCCNPVVKERPTFSLIHSVLIHFKQRNQFTYAWLEKC